MSAVATLLKKGQRYIIELKEAISRTSFKPRDISLCREALDFLEKVLRHNQEAERVNLALEEIGAHVGDVTRRIVDKSRYADNNRAAQLELEILKKEYYSVNNDFQHQLVRKHHLESQGAENFMKNLQKELSVHVGILQEKIRGEMHVLV